MKAICDNCIHYSVSQGGTTETCHAKRIGSKHIIHMTNEYIEKRMNAEIKHCKEFKKI